MPDPNSINRRRFLKSVGVASIGAVGASGVAAADPSHTGAPIKKEIIGTSKTTTTVQIHTKPQNSLIKYDWENDTAASVQLEPDNKINPQFKSQSQNIPLEEASPSITPAARTPIVEDAVGINRTIGNCASFYNNHNYAAVGFDLEDDFQSIYTAVGSAVLCDVIFRFFSRKVALLAKIFNSNKLAAAIDGVCGWTINQIISTIDGAVFTVGGWDIDTGWANLPELAIGSSGGFGVGYGRLAKWVTVDAVHTEAL